MRPPPVGAAVAATAADRPSASTGAVAGRGFPTGAPVVAGGHRHYGRRAPTGPAGTPAGTRTGSVGGPGWLRGAMLRVPRHDPHWWWAWTLSGHGLARWLAPAAPGRTPRSGSRRRWGDVGGSGTTPRPKGASRSRPRCEIWPPTESRTMSTPCGAALRTCVVRSLSAYSGKYSTKYGRTCSVGVRLVGSDRWTRATIVLWRVLGPSVAACCLSR